MFSKWPTKDPTNIYNSGEKETKSNVTEHAALLKQQSKQNQCEVSSGQ